jgi:uncharacterized membrane protein YsdA (DUF1294 family)
MGSRRGVNFPASEPNLVRLIMMGYDKSQAESGGGRVREMTLWKVAFIGGAFGVLAGESAFYHKTQT